MSLHQRVYERIRGAPDGLTKVDLTHEMRTNKSAVSNVIFALMQLGLVESQPEHREGSRGRPEVRYVCTDRRIV